MMKLLSRNRIPEVDMPEGRTLTEREMEVLDLLARGYSTRQIAGSLGIAFYTTTTHLKRIYKKLGVHRRTDAVVMVLNGGLFKQSARLKPRKCLCGLNDQVQSFSLSTA